MQIGQVERLDKIRLDALCTLGINILKLCSSLLQSLCHHRVTALSMITYTHTHTHIITASAQWSKQCKEQIVFPDSSFSWMTVSQTFTAFCTATWRHLLMHVPSQIRSTDASWQDWALWKPQSAHREEKSGAGKQLCLSGWRAKNVQMTINKWFVGVNSPPFPQDHKDWGVAALG